MTDRQKQIETKTKELAELLKAEATEAQKTTERQDFEVAALLCVSIFDNKEKTNNCTIVAVGAEASFDHMIRKGFCSELKAKMCGILMDPFEALLSRMKHGR